MDNRVALQKSMGFGEMAIWAQNGIHIAPKYGHFGQIDRATRNRPKSARTSLKNIFQQSAAVIFSKNDAPLIEKMPFAKFQRRSKIDHSRPI